MSGSAIILAAGQGTRLRPLTNEKPKCLVELAGRPLLAHQVDALRSAGIDTIVVVAGYRADLVETLASELRISVVHNPDFATTNMVATLFAAETWFPRHGDMVIAYGDIVYGTGVASRLQDCDASVCVAVDAEWRRLWELRMDDPLCDAETLKIDAATGNIIELGKKPRGYEDIEAQYMGLIKVGADAVDAFCAAYRAMDRAASYDGKTFDNMYMTSFLQHLIDNGWAVRAVRVENDWCEIDTLEDLDRYERIASGAEHRLVRFPVFRRR